jgi:hypothetical protein
MSLPVQLDPTLGALPQGPPRVDQFSLLTSAPSRFMSAMAISASFVCKSEARRVADSARTTGNERAFTVESLLLQVSAEVARHTPARKELFRFTLAACIRWRYGEGLTTFLFRDDPGVRTKVVPAFETESQGSNQSDETFLRYFAPRTPLRREIVAGTFMLREALAGALQRRALR